MVLGEMVAKRELGWLLPQEGQVLDKAQAEVSPSEVQFLGPIQKES